jgi:hypothetical protein
MSLATMEATVLGKLRSLPPEKQQQALAFIESLEQEAPAPKPVRRSLKGALSHLKLHFTTEDLREARREMWRGPIQEELE